MADKIYKNNYWENEESETIEFGNSFMRCFDVAGKLQIGKVIKNKTTDERNYIVKAVIDRKELFNSKEGVDFLRGTLDVWEEMLEE